jgi:hypothetical protein
MERAYRSTVWDLPDDYLSYARFRQAIRELEMSSSPGYPYVRGYPTIREWLGFDGINMDESQVALLWMDVCDIIESRGVSENLMRVFIKQEPHKLAKAENNRWRLIVASPLNVQVVWQMLFRYQNDLEIEKCYDIPSQQGVILCGGGWKTFKLSWEARGFNVGLDKTAWDWTAPGWAFDVDLEFRRRMGRGRKITEWHALAKELYLEMFERAKLLLSDGTIYEQKYPGIMKSGCVNTISTNSHMQVMIHYLACWEQGVDAEPVCVACGDDTLQCMFQSEDVEAYRKFGALVKSASEGLEFVGHEFLDSGPRPLYFEKHLYKLMTVKDELLDSYMDSMLRLYCHSPLYSFWEKMCLRLRVYDVKSREFYQFWYDYEG